MIRDLCLLLAGILLGSAVTGLIGRIKIGYSTDVAKRFMGLRGSSGEPLHLLGWVDATESTEATLHERFERYRDHGEWFRPVDDLLEYIRENARSA